MISQFSICTAFFVIALSITATHAVGQSGFVSAANAFMDRQSDPFSGCPAGTYSSGTSSPAASCSKVVGQPICAKSGWTLNQQGMCVPPYLTPESPKCVAGELEYLPMGLGCVEQFISLPYGSPLPSRYEACMARGLGNGRIFSPATWCEDYVRDQEGAVSYERVRQCVFSGKGSGHPMSSEAYCNMYATEIWSSPEYAGSNQIWISK